MKRSGEHQFKRFAVVLRQMRTKTSSIVLDAPLIYALITIRGRIVQRVLPIATHLW